MPQLPSRISAKTKVCVNTRISALCIQGKVTAETSTRVTRKDLQIDTQSFTYIYKFYSYDIYATSRSKDTLILDNTN
jgi:hypothetical protein